MLTTYYPNDQKHIVEARVNGLRVGEVRIYNATGQLINKIKYDAGKIDCIEYQQNGIRHNEHSPAHMEWYYAGQICHISYWRNGIRHNLHGPAIMVLYGSGQIYYIEYWQNGLRHNLHGIAIMSWGINGKICSIEYYHFGKLIQKYKI